EIARHSNGGRAEVDDVGARPLVDQQARASHANLLHLGCARQRKKHDLRFLGDLAHAFGDLYAVRLKALERFRPDVESADLLAALRRYVATDRLAHHAYPDETDHFFSFFVEVYTDARDGHSGAPGPAALVFLALARGARAGRELAARRPGSHRR